MRDSGHMGVECVKLESLFGALESFLNAHEAKQSRLAAAPVFRKATSQLFIDFLTAVEENFFYEDTKLEIKVRSIVDGGLMHGYPYQKKSKEVLELLLHHIQDEVNLIGRHLDSRLKFSKLITKAISRGNSGGFQNIEDCWSLEKLFLDDLVGEGRLKSLRIRAMEMRLKHPGAAYVVDRSIFQQIQQDFRNCLGRNSFEIEPISRIQEHSLRAMELWEYLGRNKTNIVASRRYALKIKKAINVYIATAILQLQRENDSMPVFGSIRIVRENKKVESADFSSYRNY